MICGICLENIYFSYYKGNCDCKCYYHIDCIKEWYKKRKICIYCKKKDNINIRDIGKKQNQLIENILLLLACLVVILTLNYNNIFNGKY